MRRISWSMLAALAVLAAALLLPGCAAREAPAPAGPPFGLAVPDWVTAAPGDIPRLYAWAGQHREELQYIPCYCGCGSFGHRNNFECYFKAEGEQVVGYDNHAYG